MFISLNGTFYRIAFAAFVDKVLDGAIHPEGRFHHNGQPAFYASPSPETAAVAIDIYLKDNDADRVLIPLHVHSDRIVDLRDPDTTSWLGIHSKWASVPWADERARDKLATSWKASDAVRASGADGMIYSSRRVPSRWHIAIFQWNKPGTGTIKIAETPRSWSAAATN